MSLRAGSIFDESGRSAKAELDGRIDSALEALCGTGSLSDEGTALAARAASEGRQPLDLAICGLALMGEEELAAAFSEIYDLPRFDPSAMIDANAAVAISGAFLRANRIAPVAVRDDAVVVALADPTDLEGLKGCRFAFGRRALPVIGTATEIDRLLDQVAASPHELPEADYSMIDSNDLAALRDLSSAAPTVRLCNKLISEAARLRASDIHIEPEERCYRIRRRVDGVLAAGEALSISDGLAVVSRFKILGALDIAERRRPQDGRFSFPVAGKPIDLRISSTPNVHGESLVLRLLERSDVKFDLGALGFAASDASLLHRLSDRPNGVLLLTGPTGSGKTTTLYALLQRLAARDVKILTIEDPVEYRIDGVSQTQVNPAIGLTFASALRSFLRHDPDIIMVGEMRDLETARTAIQAALTGHLVLSTLHTNDAPSAITRLLDLGVEDFLVASTVLGVVGQRLVRQTCPHCDGARKPRDISAPPCVHCGGAGYRGRIAIAEVLEVDDSLRDAIKSRPNSAKLLSLAKEAGFRTMQDDGEEKVLQGRTTREELLRAVAQ